MLVNHETSNPGHDGYFDQVSYTVTRLWFFDECGLMVDVDFQVVDRLTPPSGCSSACSFRE